MLEMMTTMVARREARREDTLTLLVERREARRVDTLRTPAHHMMKTVMKSVSAMHLSMEVAAHAMDPVDVDLTLPLPLTFHLLPAHHHLLPPLEARRGVARRVDTHQTLLIPMIILQTPPQEARREARRVDTQAPLIPLHPMILHPILPLTTLTTLPMVVVVAMEVAAPTEAVAPTMELAALDMEAAVAMDTATDMDTET